ncbi:Uncharacterised protein [Providencia stuartii]|nr:Uncharacterised protein [Providencia stuartii]
MEWHVGGLNYMRLAALFDDFLLQYKPLEQIFFQFYPQMIQQAEQGIFVDHLTTLKP